ncbi:MAG: Zinc metalloprotease [Actinotalea sp.]|nr:Zinc metalloprotease [Actinotalea sp.]
MQRNGRPLARSGGTRGWVVGHAAGAPVVVSPGWLLAAVVMTFLFAPTVDAVLPGLGAGTYAVAAVGALLLFGSVFLHELAHALVARRCGVVVREIAVTLLGGHTRMGAAAPTPGRSAAIAASGPAVNLVLAAVAWAAVLVLPVTGVTNLLLTSAAVANGFVGVFNLLPGLPLDGGRVLEALLWRVTGRRSTGTVAAGWVGRVVAVGVLAWAVLPPVLAGAQPDLTMVVWSALIGAFLWSGAAQAVRGAKAGALVDAVTVAGLMRPAVTFPATGTVGDLDLADRRSVDAAGVGPGGATSLPDVVLVDAAGRPTAYVERSVLPAVPGPDRTSTPLTAVAVQLPSGSSIPHDLTGAPAVQAVGAAARTSPVMAVLGPAGVVGLLRAQDVISVLRRGT